MLEIIALLLNAFYVLLAVAVMALGVGSILLAIVIATNKELRQAIMNLCNGPSGEE